MANTPKYYPTMYENKYHRKDQEDLINIYMNYTQATAYDCPTRYPLDYLCKRNGRTVAFVECRKRKKPFGFYPTVYCSMKKVMFGRDVINHFGIPVIFLVKFSDNVIATVQFDEDGFVDMQKVNFRDDVYDLEPVMNWKIEKFRIIQNIN